MKSRRIVNRIEPARNTTLDQFWPVLVSLCVLFGIASGAIVTLMRGPWMLGSLLLMVIGTSVAVVALYRIDNRKLRRAVQLGLILSVALHLLVLMVASVIGIFRNDYQFVKPQTTSRPNRVVEISNNSNPLVIERHKPIPTQETPVEVQRTTTSVTSRPQPVPVESTESPVQPELVRRQQPSQTVPRLDRDLSQMKRQERSLEIKSAEQSVSTPAPRQPREAPREAERSAETEIARQSSASEIQRARSEQTPLEQSPVQANNSLVSRRNSSARPESVSRTDEPSLQSQAPRRQSEAQITIARPKKTLTENSEAPTSEREADSEPTRSSSQITRRETVSELSRPAELNQPQTELSPVTQIARAEMVNTGQTQPTISREDSSVRQPRRSSINRPAPSTTEVAESPSRAPKSDSNTQLQNERTLSVERGETGVTGTGNASNLDRDLGGIQSNAVQASDSSTRRRSESRPTDQPVLVSSQRSEVRRSRTQELRPQSAFQVNTTEPSKIAGSRTPSTESLESSAARLDSSSAAHRAELNVQRGESSTDIGTTKIVQGETTRRRSGGGQPEVTELNPDSTRRSNVDSNERRPTLVAQADVITSAPSTTTSAPQSASDPQTDTAPVAFQREGGASQVTLERAAAVESGEASNRGDSELAEQLASNRQRAESEARVDSGQFDELDDRQHQGNRDRGVARAPLVRQSDQIGNDRFNGGVRDIIEDASGESVVAKVVERSSGTLAGTVERETNNRLVGSAATEPLADAGPVNPSAQRRSRDPDSSTSSTQMENGEALVSRAPATERAPAVNPIETESFDGPLDRGTSDSEIKPAEVVVQRAESQTATQGAALDVDAEEGPAGLGQVVTEHLGVRNRPASRESELIAPANDARFRSERFGGNPAVNPDAIVAQEAFVQRTPQQSSGGEPTNEATIQLGLEWLIKHQSADGKWALTGFDTEHPAYRNQLDCDTAATGLALLAFQGAGYNHREFKYARQMNHAIEWLIENQDEDGCLFVPTGTRSDKFCRMYSHGIAALALTEAYGMTQDPQLRGPAQRALDYIALTQDPKRGGWRYFAETENRQSDTSVTGWMMMAMQSGRLAGLEINEQTMRGIGGWLDAVVDPKTGYEFSYNPYTKDSETISREQGRTTSTPMTAVGLLMQMYNGWDRDDPRLIAGAQSLIDNRMPNDLDVLQRDTYYWYYATQVLLHMGGDSWETWHQSLHPLLVDSQVQEGDMAGSWHPYEPVPDRWGVHAGRLYVTTMNLLSLEVRNRKLPLYDETAK